MKSSSMFFDKPAGGAPPHQSLRPRQSRRAARGGERRTRSDSIPRHGASDPQDKYYGSDAQYFGRDSHEELTSGLNRGYSGARAAHRRPAISASREGDGGAFWDIYDDDRGVSAHSSAGTKVSNGSGGGGGAYWDIYDDTPSYRGPSYRDLRVKKKQGANPGSGASKGYEMKRSAPIDSPFTMMSDHKAQQMASSRAHEPQRRAGGATADAGTGISDLQSPNVQKTVRPAFGLGFSRWEGRQDNDDAK